MLKLYCPKCGKMVVPVESSVSGDTMLACPEAHFWIMKAEALEQDLLVESGEQ